MTIRPLYTSAATQPASSAAPATAGPSDARGKQLRYDHAELHAAHKAGVLPKADAWMVICDGEPHAYPHLSQYIPWSSNFYAPRWMPLQFMREEVAAPAASVGVEPSDALLKMAKAAMHCLRSYQYGNAQPDLAKAIADALEMTIKNAAPTAHEAGQQPVAWGEWQRVAAEFIERLTVLAYRRGCVSDRNVDGLFAEQQLLEREFLAHLAAPAAPRALLGKALVALTELHEAEEATYPNAEHGQAAQTAWSTRKAEAHEKARAAITELREALGAK